MNHLQSDLSGQILKAYYIVYSRLGFGFPENVYENAMIIELVKQGLYCTLQRPLNVFYDEISVGKCFAEIIVNEQIILEVKCRDAINLDGGGSTTLWINDGIRKGIINTPSDKEGERPVANIILIKEK